MYCIVYRKMVNGKWLPIL